MFSASLQCVRGLISGGFTSKIVRVKHSMSQPSVVANVFFPAFSGIGFSVGVITSVILFRRA